MSADADGSAFERVMAAVERLDLTVARWSQNDDATVQCPMEDHYDETPSLHVSDSGEGSVLLYCFGCGADVGELAAALGLSIAELYDVPGSSTRPGARAAHLAEADHRRGLKIAEGALFHEWLETLPDYWIRRAYELTAAGCELEATCCVHHAELLGGLR